MTLELIPAIDLRQGQCVRLLRGNFDAQTDYPVEPVALAEQFRDSGARWLHVVDLDGAKEGARINQVTIAALGAVDSLQVQVGGGIRDDASLEDTLTFANRAVVGSAALADPDRFGRWLSDYGPERVVLALDVMVDDDGEAQVKSHGWQENSGWSLDRALTAFVAMGLQHVLCTDIERDGAMVGPNLDLYRRCRATWPTLDFQASGGIRHINDLHRLEALGMPAAISGKAILEGALTLEEARPFLPSA